MDFKPSLKQYKAWQKLEDQTTDFVGYGGSAFSGKSYLLCFWITLNAKEYPDTAWGIGRRELSNLKRTTLLTLFKVFKEIGIEDYSYNGQYNVITFANKSQIFLIDTAYRPSDPLFTRFGGFELTSCGIDESAETDYKAIDILSTRIGRRNNDKYNLKAKILETFNPDKGHVYRRYYKPLRDNELPDNYAFIKALPKDNPSPEVDPYVKRILRTADKVTIERLIYGNFEYDDDPTKLIEFDAIIDIWNNNHVEGGQKYITADIARLGSDNAVVIVWDGFRVKEIQSFPKTRLNEIGDILTMLQGSYKVPNRNVIVDEDGVGGGVVDFMNVRGFVNGSKALNGENYTNLKSQCYYLLAKLINESGLYIESDKYKDSIIEELEQVKSYKIDSDAKLRVMPKDKVKEVLGHSPDYSDALMMRMYFTLHKVKKIYRKVL